MNIIGKNIRKERINQGMTQEQLIVQCQLINFDMSRSTLAKVESSNRQVIDKEILLFAQVLNIPISDLFLE